jgi:hypothetical protein
MVPLEPDFDDESAMALPTFLPSAFALVSTVLTSRF